jgi:hypothetical protein
MVSNGENNNSEIDSNDLILKNKEELAKTYSDLSSFINNELKYSRNSGHFQNLKSPTFKKMAILKDAKNILIETNENDNKQQKENVICSFLFKKYKNKINLN